MYWIREGEYIYMAATPQPLIDRTRAGAKTRVADWLDAAARRHVDLAVRRDRIRAQDAAAHV